MPPTSTAGSELATMSSEKVLTINAFSSQPSKVCLDSAGQKCVPLSILLATFQDWVDGDISPLAKEQAAHSDTYARWRNAEHQLAQARAELMKLAAPKESEGLESIRSNWLKAVQDAAPPGMTFDEKSGKYVPKPDEPAKQTDKPKGGGV